MRDGEEGADLFDGHTQTSGHTSGPCRSCRRLRSFDVDFKDQKIAACGSSYRDSSNSFGCVDFGDC
ncbi:hypothetical protein C2E19_18845 [Pseudomonas sp. DTU12.3]|nr:hypothetical protein C2E19_18845 [Pseudomonas sp. DTU12.3]